MEETVMKLPIILLPGLMCDQRIFQPQLEIFSKERNVICAQTFGFETIPQIASNILETAPEQFIVAGLSLGGIVALELVRQSPQKIQKLILMDTSHRAEPEHISTKRERQIREVEKGNLRKVITEEHIPNYLADGSTTGSISKLCVEMALHLGAEVFTQQSRALISRTDQTKTLQNIEMPTMILCGKYDRLCDIKTHQKMHSLIKESTLSIIDDAGHLPTLENPIKTNRILTEWLN